MKTEYILLKEATLNNNCPECYSTENLTLSFKQKKMLSRFLVKTTTNITESMNCGVCETKIFPGQWNKDIERVYEYHKKTITPQPKSLQFTKLFYSICAITILLFAIAIGTLLFSPTLFNA